MRNVTIACVGMVEDNVVNQKVATRTLETMGYLVDVAAGAVRTTRPNQLRPLIRLIVLI